MKKWLFLFTMLICLFCLSLTANAKFYECIALADVDFCRHAYFVDDYLIMLERDGLVYTVDVSDLFTTEVFTVYFENPNPLDLGSGSGTYGAIDGQYIYTGRSTGSVIDVSDPLALNVVGTFDNSNLGVNCIIYDHPITMEKYLVTISLTTGKGIIEVWSLADPIAPALVGTATVDNEGWGIAANYDGTTCTLYISAGWTVPTLYTFNFNDPTNLGTPTNEQTLNDLPYELRTVDGYLVCSYDSEMHLFDLTDPLNPVDIQAIGIWSGRACAQDGLTLITMGDVHRVDIENGEIIKTQEWNTNGAFTGDGFPWDTHVEEVGDRTRVVMPGNWETALLRDAPAPALMANSSSISIATGGTVDFALDASIDNANRTYLILGTTRGTDPGYGLPGGNVTLPLNWDHFTDFILEFVNTPIFVDFMGDLNSEGQATALLDTLGPIPNSTSGTIMHFAYCLNNPFDFVSNTVEIWLVD